jgi:hypothetical protein
LEPLGFGRRAWGISDWSDFSFNFIVGHVPDREAVKLQQRHCHVNLMGWQKAFAWGMVAG